MKKYFSFTSLIVIIFIFVLLPISPVLADCETGNFLPDCTCSGQCQLTDFLALGSNIMRFGVGILASIAVGFFIWGGYTLLMSMGNPEKVDAGKKQLAGTFKGVAMVMLSWLLVSTIIFFATGKSDGLLFGRGDQWWKFKETELHEMYLPYETGQYCPARVAAAKSTDECSFYINLQGCRDINGLPSEDARQALHCRSLGVCPGGPEVVCCDTAEQSANSCPDQSQIDRWINGN